MSTSFAPSCPTVYLAASCLPALPRSILSCACLPHPTHPTSTYLPYLDEPCVCICVIPVHLTPTHTATHSQFVPTSLATCLHPLMQEIPKQTYNSHITLLHLMPKHHATPCPNTCLPTLPQCMPSCSFTLTCLAIPLPTSPLPAL